MWLVLMKQTKNGTGQPQSYILASVMVDILILFHTHSNADYERIILFVFKTKTVFFPQPIHQNSQ